MGRCALKLGISSADVELLLPEEAAFCEALPSSH